MRAFTNRAGEASGTFFGEAGARKWSGWSSLRGPERNELCPRAGAEGRLEAIFRAYQTGQQEQPQRLCAARSSGTLANFASFGSFQRKCPPGMRAANQRYHKKYTSPAMPGPDTFPPYSKRNFVFVLKWRGDLKRFSERTGRGSKSSRSFFLIKWK